MRDRFFLSILSVIDWAFLPVLSFSILLICALVCLPGIAQAQTPPPPSFEKPVQGPGQESPQVYPFSSAGLSPREQTPLYGEGWAYLVFQSYRDGNWEIYYSPNLGSSQVRLTASNLPDTRPQLHPEASQLVYVVSRTSDTEIFKMNVDGSGATNLTNSKKIDEAVPVWSPDGGKIAYAKELEKQWDLFVMDADGSAPVQLTADGAYDDYYPTWSPDGARIAWMRVSDAGRSIWIMNADGSNPHPLTSALRYLQNISWSPDGSRLAFDCDMDGDDWNELAVINIDGTGLQAVYDANTYMVDAWMGSWAFNGTSLIFTRVEYIEYRGGLYIYHAFVERAYLDFHTSNRLTYTGLDLAPNFVCTDDQAPVFDLPNLPPYSRVKDFILYWSQSDPGISGIAEQHIQGRQGSTGAWTDLFLGKAYQPWIYLDVDPGADVYFRIRGRDEAGYWSGWSPNTPHSTFYTWQLSGQVKDNRAYPLFGVPISINPEPVTAAHTGSDGSYFTRLSAEGLHDLQVNVPGYKMISRTALEVMADVIHDVWLGPTDDVLLNGGFEASSSELSHWTTSAHAVVKTIPRDTGQYAALAGVYCPAGLCPGDPEFTPFFSGVSPSITLDQPGNLHVILSSQGDPGIYHRMRSPSGVWSDSTLIPGSNTGTIPYHKTDLASDVQGNLYAVWSYAIYGSSGVYFSQRSASTGAWSASHSLGSGTDPAIVVDHQGRVHVGFRGSDTPGFYYIERTASGQWQPPEKLDEMSFWGADVGLGPDGAVHFVWHEADKRKVIHKVRREDGSWTQPEELDLSAHGLSVVVDVQNRVHIFAGGQHVSRDVSGAWSEPERVLEENSEIDVAVDGQGTLYIIGSYQFEGEYSPTIVYRAKRTGLPWTDPVPVKGSTFGNFSITTDSANRFHIIGSETWGGSQWGIQYLTNRPPAGASFFWIAQSQPISISMNHPTLSFWYRLDSYESWANSGLAITATAATKSERIFFDTHSPEWTHAWLDLSEWVGQNVTVTFGLEQAAGEPYVNLYLDDISLGSWLTPVVTGVAPGNIVEGWAGQTITVTGENFIQGATVFLDDNPVSGVMWIDEHTLQFNLPASLPPGVFDVWVVNPGGQKGSLAAGLKLGNLSYLPMTVK